MKPGSPTYIPGLLKSAVGPFIILHFLRCGVELSENAGTSFENSLLRRDLWLAIWFIAERAEVPTVIGLVDVQLYLVLEQEVPK